MMRLRLAYACGCFFTLDLDRWVQNPDGELRACHAHGHPAGEAGHPARWPVSLTYHEEGGRD